MPDRPTPMLTDEAMEAARERLTRPGAVGMGDVLASFFAAQDRDALAAAVCDRLGWIGRAAVAEVIDVLLGGPDA